MSDHITQQDIDAFKRQHKLCPESLETLYRQNRMMELLQNGGVLTNIIYSIKNGELNTATNGATIKL